MRPAARPAAGPARLRPRLRRAARRSRTCRPGSTSPPEPRVTRRWRAVEIDPDGAVRVPGGTALDLGATAKAWAADLVATACRGRARRRRAGQRGRRRRASPAPRRAVAGRDHRAPGHVGRPGGQARRGRAGDLQHRGSAAGRRHGARRHHLLDPRTGLPAAEVWRTVTATGPTCLAANVASTAAVVLGERRRRPGWPRGGSTARLVAADGAVHRVGDWPWPATAPRRRSHDRRSPALVRQPRHRHRAAGAAHGLAWSSASWRPSGRAGGGVPQFVRQDLHRNVALLSRRAARRPRRDGGPRHLRRHPLVAGARPGRRRPISRCGWGWVRSSLDLLVVIVLTSLVRTRMRHRAWRLVHLLVVRRVGVWAWPTASGSAPTRRPTSCGDCRSAWRCIAAVVAGLVVRAARARRAPSYLRRGGARDRALAGPGPRRDRRPAPGRRCSPGIADGPGLAAPPRAVRRRARHRRGRPGRARRPGPAARTRRSGVPVRHEARGPRPRADGPPSWSTPSEGEPA